MSSWYKVLQQFLRSCSLIAAKSGSFECDQKAASRQPVRRMGGYHHLTWQTNGRDNVDQSTISRLAQRAVVQADKKTSGVTGPFDTVANVRGAERRASHPGNNSPRRLISAWHPLRGTEYRSFFQVIEVA